MRIGVIGTGRIGTFHANTLSRHREVGSLILTDADPARAQELALRLAEAELSAFVEVVRGERPNPCDGREALQALRVAEACEVSRREHRPVPLAEIPGAARAVAP